MYISHSPHLIAILLLNLPPISLAFTVPKAPAPAPAAAAGAGTNVAGSGARAGNRFVPGGPAQVDNSYRAGAGQARPGSESGSKESTGEVFEKVIGIVRDSAMSNGNDGNNPNTATITQAPIPTSAVADPNARACLQANDIYDRCVAQTPSFDGINTSSQASCLCYGTASDGIYWQPQSYGGLMTTCYRYVNGLASQTIDSGDVWDQAYLCAKVGDVRQSAASEAYATENSVATSTRPAIPESTGGAMRLGGSSARVFIFSVGLLLGGVFG